MTDHTSQETIDQQISAAEFTQRGQRDFNPMDHISYLEHKSKSGRMIRTPYMQVKWRKVWFRSVYPNGKLDVQLVHVSDDGLATCRAEVVAIDNDGIVCGSAADFGMCHRNERGRGGATRENDFIQWASTRAIGRALTNLGFGIDDAEPSDDDDATTKRPAPAQRPQNAPQRAQQGKPAPVPQQQAQRPPAAQQQAQQPRETNDPLTAPQKGRIEKAAIDRNLRIDHVFDMASGIAARPITGWNQINKALASQLIERVESEPRRDDNAPMKLYHTAADRSSSVAALGQIRRERQLRGDQLDRIAQRRFNKRTTDDMNAGELYQLVTMINGCSNLADLLA